MKASILLYLILMLFPASTAFSKDPDWLLKMKQIKILFDTRESILKLLGPPVDNERGDYLWYYDFKAGRMSITYETGICSENTDSKGRTIGWKVPEWTVVGISFSPDKHIYPKRLAIDFNQFVRKPVKTSLDSTPNDIKRAPYLFEYYNDDLGIYYFEEYGKISGISFYPSSKFDKLRCP